MKPSKRKQQVPASSAADTAVNAVLVLLGAAAVGAAGWLISDQVRRDKAEVSSTEAANTENKQVNQELRDIERKAGQGEPAAQASMPSRPDSAWQAVADQIYESIRYSAASDNKRRAEDLLKEPFTLGDLLKLRELYGSRQLYVFGIPEGPPRTLAQAIASELSADAIRRINEEYMKKGINFRW